MKLSMKQTLYRFVSHFFFPKKTYALIFAIIAIALYTSSGFFIFENGGTAKSSVHLLYIPIVFISLGYGIIGGTFGGLIAALIAGPWMPFSREPNIMQPHDVWVFRGFFFIFIGALIGFGASIFRNFADIQKQRLLTDPLTGLYNLRGLRNIIEQSNAPEPHTLSVVLIELRQLPNIEKAMGPAATQKLLRHVAAQLQEIIGNHGHLGYLETGSFILLALEHNKDVLLVDLCRSFLGNIFTIDDIQVFVEFYYGAAQSTDIDYSLVSTLRKAKVAVVNASSNRRTASFYSIDDDFNGKRNMRITHDLNFAILNNQLKLVYQPKYALKTKEMVGLEALVRWPHPELGMIPPAEFIPVIESTLLINPFTKWLLQEVMHQMMAWRDLKIDISVAVNFSMINFQDATIIEYLNQLFAQTSISPKFLEIEVTETAVAQNIKEVADILHALRESGIRIAIDDFGTGQASMQYLCELPVDTLKIDKFFIQDMLTNSASEAIVRSSVLLGHELNLSVVAEGIETQEHLDKLIAIGCDYGQGYFLAKPMYPEDLIPLIQKRCY